MPQNCLQTDEVPIREFIVYFDDFTFERTKAFSFDHAESLVAETNDKDIRMIARL